MFRNLQLFTYFIIPYDTLYWLESFGSKWLSRAWREQDEKYCEEDAEGELTSKRQTVFLAGWRICSLHLYLQEQKAVILRPYFPKERALKILLQRSYVAAQ